MDNIIQIIGNLGFPVAVCIIMLYFNSCLVNQMNDQFQQVLDLLIKLVSKIDGDGNA